MLIDDRNVEYPDLILAIVASASGRGAASRRVARGIYEIGHFGHSQWPKGFDHYPDFGERPCSGVADDEGQILEQYPELQDLERQFIITLTPIVKAMEPLDGGWRWHKWGPYIGKQAPTQEYLAHEPVIERVVVFHIYEKTLG